MKLLVCAPSNTACDEIVRKLNKLKNSNYNPFTQSAHIVRIGRPDCIHMDSAEYNIDNLFKIKYDLEYLPEQFRHNNSLRNEYNTYKTKRDTLKTKLKIYERDQVPDNDIRVRYKLICNFS